MAARMGLLIIRAWIEPGSSEPLRATVRTTDDVNDGLERPVTLADRDRVCSLVDAWLGRVITAPPA